MSRESCINHPAGARFLIIREDYLAITGDNPCAAGLLAILEHWHNVKLNNREQAVEHNKAARQSDMPADQDVELWVYKSQAEFRLELFNLWAEKAIAASLQTLYDQGFIETRQNPRFKWDRTTQFLFNTAAVQLALYETEVYRAAQIDNPPIGVMEAAKRRDGLRQKAQAIPEITTKKTTEHTKRLPGTKAPARKKEESERSKLGIPDPAEGVLDAICTFLYGDLDGWKLNAWRIQKLYNEIASKFAPPTIENLRAAYAWWFVEDYRGKTNGSNPEPAQLIEKWSIAIKYDYKAAIKKGALKKRGQKADEFMGKQQGDGSQWGFKSATPRSKLP